MYQPTPEASEGRRKKELVLAYHLAEEVKVKLPVAKAASALYEKVLHPHAYIQLLDLNPSRLLTFTART